MWPLWFVRFKIVFLFVSAWGPSSVKRKGQIANAETESEADAEAEIEGMLPLS